MKPSLIHICVYQRLINSVNPDGTIERHRLLEILGRLYHIPKDSRNNIIKELEDCGLIEVIDKFKIKILDGFITD